MTVGAVLRDADLPGDPTVKPLSIRNTTAVAAHHAGGLEAAAAVLGIDDYNSVAREIDFRPHLRALAALADSLATLTRNRVPVALRTEGPHWIPLPSKAETMGKGRPGEPIAWSSSPGATVLARGLQQLTWLLTRLDPKLRVGLDVDLFLDGKLDIVLWEAYVTGSAHATGDDSHVADARAAAKAMAGRLRHATHSTTGWHVPTDIAPLGRVISLAGLSLLASGHSTDPAVGREPVTLVKPPPLASQQDRVCPRAPAQGGLRDKAAAKPPLRRPLLGHHDDEVSQGRRATVPDPPRTRVPPGP